MSGLDVTRYIKRNQNTNRFELSLNNLVREDPDLFEKLSQSPSNTLHLIKESCRIIIGNRELFLVDAPPFLTKQISDLRSKDLGTMVKLTGILKKVSQPTSKIDSVRFECSNCGSILTTVQKDVKVKSPEKCVCGNRSRFSVLAEILIDIQDLEMEENTEDIGSRQPQKIRLLLRDELTDPAFSKFQVGNKIDILGILTKTPSFMSGKDGDRTVLEYLIEVLELTSKEDIEQEIEFSEEELQLIQNIASNNPLQTLADNLAPNISGLDHIKKALTLFLAKGVTKQIDGGERRRGNIHLLVIGDAGLAKSALIQNIQKRSVNCRIADGKDASKAGIVAMVNKDPNTNKWSLEAGDIVLANNGYLLIDEADKLPENDRKALHRPMEQGEVVISKAGIHATLQCNTSIFAVANPKTGMFMDGKSIIEQIEFSPTLLSRFDLIFILKDNPDKEFDLIKANQILGVHQGEGKLGMPNSFIKKYFLHISKRQPKLTKEVMERISQIYATIRGMSEKDGSKVGMPITPRHLEGLIRMSEAHAKLRLSEFVELIDVDIAEGMFKHSLSDFGVNMESGSVDISSITTKVKTSKKGKYYQILEILKGKAKLTNEFKKKEIFPELQRLTGLNYGDLEEIFSMLHKEGDIFEHKTNVFRIIQNE